MDAQVTALRELLRVAADHADPYTSLTPDLIHRARRELDALVTATNQLRALPESDKKTLADFSQFLGLPESKLVATSRSAKELRTLLEEAEDYVVSLYLTEGSKDEYRCNSCGGKAVLGASEEHRRGCHTATLRARLRAAREKLG